MVDGDTICVFQIPLHDGNIVLDFLFSLFAGDERRDIIHWSRTVQGVHRNQVFELGRLQLFQILLHTGRFKLECTCSLSVAIQFVGCRIFQADMVDIQFMARCQPDVFDRFFNDGQCFQP